MTEDDILLRLTAIFRDVFGDETIVLRPETTADDIAGWDSMSQVTLAVEVEQRFRLKFKSAEMERMSSVRHLIDLIRSRTEQTGRATPAKIPV